MEALVIALAVVAIILIVLWLLRWFQRRRASGSTAGQDRVELPVVVVIDIPHGQRASLVAALEKRIDDPIRIGAGAHRSMVPPPSASVPGRDQVVINARNGARALDLVLAELRGRGFRVEAAEGRTITLSGWAGAEATVVVRGVGRDAA
jgi:hypothetical protein